MLLSGGHHCFHRFRVSVLHVGGEIGMDGGESGDKGGCPLLIVQGCSPWCGFVVLVALNEDFLTKLAG